MAVYLGQNDIILHNGISTTGADAAADMLAGKTVHANDKKLLGAMPARENIYCEAVVS